eukprot:TRINITY_DN14791_c0_g1_i1.p1 TRINITY_DN14791_c0_g1~~TRINITY_DN14791_c0_g1_i1.p1  ORF type:complete len:454 (+),score=61.54 TRINITY_DN14791_c0_g1_i1:37-1398(+)
MVACVLRGLLVTLVIVCSVDGFLAPTNPPWPGTYRLKDSTICMAVNSSGYFNISRATQFDVVSYDWSNAKAQWVNVRPMDCEQRLLYQAEATKLHSPKTHVFVYRNLVKALPWFSSVRNILDDPQYSGFFLKFANYSTVNARNKTYYHVPACTTQDGVTKCSEFYHDQEQTPEVPSLSDRHPDGACQLYCDCGTVPCGEYLFDHRNGSLLTEWLIKDYILSDTAVGSPFIDGLFIDDYWCSDIINGSQNCTDPVQGPSEIDPYSQIDMGLSDEDIADITEGWLYNMKQVQSAILSAKGYTWSLMPYQANANAQPLVLNQSICHSVLNFACQVPNPFEDAPLLSGITLNTSSDSNLFPFLVQQVAGFLLMRGPSGFIGYGEWGMEWPPEVELPDLVFGDHDFGEPLQPSCSCHPLLPHLWVRDWSNARVELDCATWQASIQMLKPPYLSWHSKI